MNNSLVFFFLLERNINEQTIERRLPTSFTRWHSGGRNATDGTFKPLLLRQCLDWQKKKSAPSCLPPSNLGIKVYVEGYYLVFNQAFSPLLIIPHVKRIPERQKNDDDDDAIRFAGKPFLSHFRVQIFAYCLWISIDGCAALSGRVASILARFFFTALESNCAHCQLPNGTTSAIHRWMLSFPVYQFGKK